ncbi:MAG: GntR family transcriptional regulator [Rhodobacteraceae bacterium]|jgi:DNA-binding GntR family transcriptional regulator|nr:GntR family transcriptional regulator [Paracoccaceae bacterium]
MASPAPETPRTQHDGSVRSSAYERFQTSLLAGLIRPGQLISQRELVGMLDVSLGALRELLPRLEAEGLLSVIPQRGIQVTAIDIRMIRNAYQMRMALEREAVISAIDHVVDADLHAQIAIHREILARAEHAMGRELLDEAQEIDSGMHNFLIGATGNDQLVRGYQIIGIRVRLINIDRIRLTPAVLPQAFGDHLRILDAILRRSRADAVAAMEHHIIEARNRAVSF